MDITFLNEYAVPVIIGICLCIGFVIKHLVPGDRVNQYIPLLVAVLGVLLNVWIEKEFTPAVMLGGMFSGLCSTGTHQLVKQFEKLFSSQE